jgi:hypothetical protein
LFREALSEGERREGNPPLGGEGRDTLARVARIAEESQQVNLTGFFAERSAD